MHEMQRVPATAPPHEYSFYSPSQIDPFEGSPSTAVPGGSFLPNLSYDDPPPQGTHPRGKKYPRIPSHGKGESDDDKEESVSLVRNPLESESDTKESESEAETDLETGPPVQGGIRLLSSSTRI